MSDRAFVRAAVVALVVLVAGCVASKDKDNNNNKRITRALVSAQSLVSAQTGPTKLNEPVLPTDEFLVYVDGKPILPAYKTEWERESERKFKEARAKGLPYADTFDDYRNQNIGDFFITKPPTTTTIRTPAEYEQSQAYVLNWFQSSSSGYNNMFGQIVQGAWGKVPVLMIYNSTSHKSWIEQQLLALGFSASAIQNPANIIWWQHATDAYWTRDYGPVSLVTTTTPAKLSFVDYRYYHERVHDDQVPTDLAQAWGINVFRPTLEFEGGNFMNTSDMLCAMTKGVMYYNSQLSQSAIEDILKQYQACKKFLWAGEMTGGVISHIDMFSKYASDTSVLVGEYTYSQDASNYAILNANASLFSSTTTPTGKSVAVTRIPMPNKGGSSPNYIWRTYTNSVSLNGTTGKVVLIPTYAQETSKEAAAMATYAAVYPGWTLVKIVSDTIIPGQGATHCITMQIPVGQKAKMEADPGDQCGPTALSCTATVPCGSITYEGCCDGQMLKYCDNGTLQTIDCSQNPSCGWQASANYYDCGTAGTPDPSGTYPMSCGTTPPPTDLGPPPADGPPPTGCGGITYEGCCDGETLKWCEANVIQTLDCSGNPSCGWSATNAYYDCGTNGAADPSGTHPKSCGTTPPPTDLGPPPPTDGPPPTGCGGITYEGCCDGQTLKYCENNALQTIDCSQNPSCGWQASAGYYDCGTSGTPDPSGTFPKACGTTPPPPDQFVPPLTDQFVPPQYDQFVPPQYDQFVPPQYDQFVPPQSDGFVPPAGDGIPPAGDGTTKKKGSGGCGCEVAGPPSASTLLLVGLLFGLVLLQNRRRGQ